MKTEWSKYIRQKRAKGFLSKEEQLALSYARPDEMIRRLNAQTRRQLVRNLKRIFGCSS